MLALILAAAIQTTTCNTFGGTTTCNTTPRAGGFDAFTSARDAAAAASRDAEALNRRNQDRAERLGYSPECASGMWLLAGCSRRQHDEAVAAIAAREAGEVARQRALDALAAGDCTGATRIALEARDLNLAREVRDFCRP